MVETSRDRENQGSGWLNLFMGVGMMVLSWRGTVLERLLRLFLRFSQRPGDHGKGQNQYDDFYILLFTHHISRDELPCIILDRET